MLEGRANPKWNVGAILIALAACSSCNGRARSVALDTSTETSAKEAKGEGRGTEIAEFDLTSGVAESTNAGLLYSVPASRTYVGLVRTLERAALGKASGFLVRLGGEGLDWARSEELGSAFANLRKMTGKPVFCHAHGLDNRVAWFAARACSRIWVSPAGDVDTVGIAGQVVYLKGALDKLKIRADFLHMGKYKSAAESLTQEGPSDEARESLTAVLASIRSTWLDEYSASRKSPALRHDLEDGPWSAEAAKARGLIDDVGYEDDARKALEAEAHTKSTRVAFGRKPGDDNKLDVSEILRLITGGEPSTHRPHIAVVPAEGSIVMEGGSVLSESGIAFRSMQRVIRRLSSDDSVRAVVLRIDSPGGSALASDLLWHELMDLRKKKPLVASVGDMAASGGYYLACAANKVVAERTSIVGSIGVVGGKIVLDQALDQFGIHAESFPASPEPGAAARAGYMSALSPWDEPTRDKVRVQMQSVYELFLRRVSEGRGQPVEAIRAIAEGRIWSGAQGHDLHLVDELGGLGKSIALARQLADLESDTPVELEGISESIVESLLLGEGADEASVRAALQRVAARRQAAMDAIPRSLQPFVGALAPLLGGETVVAAAPFGVVVR